MGTLLIFAALFFHSLTVILSLKELKYIQTSKDINDIR